MTVLVKKPKATWYLSLMEKFELLTKQFSIPEDTASAFKLLLLETAREQYMAGNKSGIHWMKKQLTKTT